jgi:hypothetical protein
MNKAITIDLGRKLELVLALTVLAFGVAAAAIGTAAAQEPAASAAPLSADALDELVGPIALYPDDLIAIVLPASTYPLQVVQAARFLEERKDNANLVPDEDWDDSVVALLNYPEVVELMNDDLDWTWALGEAVLAQRADVLDAVQTFRDRAYAAGNLQTDDRQVVSRDEGVIAIAPADPEVIYVPYYEPERVVVYQTVPVYHYYPWSYPVYYYPYPVGYSFYSFRSGFFWGVTTAFGIGWRDHHVHVHPFGHHLHPYYGRYYYDPFYVRHGVNINVHINRAGYVWEPRYRRAAQPFARSEGRPVTSTQPRDPRARDANGYRTQSGAGTRAVTRSDAQQRSAGAQQQALPRQQQAQARQQQQAQNPAARVARGQGVAIRQRPAVEQPAAQQAAPSQQRVAPNLQRSQQAPIARTRPQAGQARNQSGAAAPREQPQASAAPQYRARGMAQAGNSASRAAQAPSAAPAQREPARAPSNQSNDATARQSGGGGGNGASRGSSYRNEGGSASSGNARSSGHPAQRGQR